MTAFLSSKNFPTDSSGEDKHLEDVLNNILEHDYKGSFFTMLAQYQHILADNNQKLIWPEIHQKLETLFKCGKAEVLSGPMIGIPISIRDSDYFKHSDELNINERSVIASIEWMATAWNATYADTGLWMGKTFEPVSRETVAEKTHNHTQSIKAYDPTLTRIGRNYFREPPDSNFIQAVGLPALTELWHLKDRPMDADTRGFDCKLLPENLTREKVIPYSKTGGYFLCNSGKSVVPEMNSKDVYQLDYRWPALMPTYPMTCLIDEIVRIDDSIYLGQLVFATRHFSLGSVPLPNGKVISIGEDYPERGLWEKTKRILRMGRQDDVHYYGYQNNGFFLMVDPDSAETFYADDAFPQLRPRSGEIGFLELGYDQLVTNAGSHVPMTVTAKQSKQWPEISDWTNGWKQSAAVERKFTSFILEESPLEVQDEYVEDMLQDGESILQMLQCISYEISAQNNPKDQLKNFEKLNALFRRGVAPTVTNGLFQGNGESGFNCRLDSDETNSWYGEPVHSTGFDYYHGATLNLHCGFTEGFSMDSTDQQNDNALFPSALANMLDNHPPPNLLNMTWHSIGKFIFPWAGKSFEKISGRKLSMLLDESDDLDDRYPERVDTLKSFLASRPHYNLIEKNKAHFWKADGVYVKHLKSGAWDQGMSDEDKAFWEHEAATHWVDGNNIQDKRIVAADPLMRIVDMNYRVPDASFLAAASNGPSPFARQGYIFLGTDDRESVLPMNNNKDKKKKVFQFHYRFPMIGGPTPIGYCLDELVEIADGLYLGQLIYSTALDLPFHSSVDSDEYRYQLFGYFLLLDDTWQYHRLAIGLDTLQ